MVEPINLIKHKPLPKVVGTGLTTVLTEVVIRDLLAAVLQLQQITFGARAVEADGMPRNLEVQEMANGVFIRLISKGFEGGLVQRIEHGLGRVPQSCIFTRSRSSHNECVLEGDEAFGGIEPATDKEVTFIIGDPVGSAVVAMLS